MMAEQRHGSKNSWHSYHKPHAGHRKSTGNGIVLRNHKSSLSVTLPPTGPHFLNIPKEFHQLGTKYWNTYLWGIFSVRYHFIVHFDWGKTISFLGRTFGCKSGCPLLFSLPVPISKSIFLVSYFGCNIALLSFCWLIEVSCALTWILEYTLQLFSLWKFNHCYVVV